MSKCEGLTKLFTMALSAGVKQGVTTGVKQFGPTQSLHVVDDTQLDTVILFLSSTSAKGSLSAWTNGEGVTSLIATRDQPSSTTHQATSHLLIRVLDQTISAAPSNANLQQLRIDISKKLLDVAFCFKAGTTLSMLSSMGTLVACAATSDQYYAPQTFPPRTPTECLVTLLDGLDAALTSSNNSQRRTIENLILEGENLRLRSQMDMHSVMSLMHHAESQLSAAAIPQLEELSCTLLEELMHYSNDPPLPRLLDNVYGRV